jgi:hypothetical protein
VSDGIGEGVADGRGVTVGGGVEVAVGGSGVGEGGSGEAVNVVVTVAVAVGGGVGEASHATWVALHPSGIIRRNNSRDRCRKILILTCKVYRGD